MDEDRDFRTKWGGAAAIVVGGSLWAWAENPVDPNGSEDFVDPVLFLLMMCLLSGLALAAICARFDVRARAANVTAWIALTVYGGWLALWTAIGAVWSGELFYCDTTGYVACTSDWPPRVATPATALLLLAACALVEGRLRRRRWWASAPS